MQVAAEAVPLLIVLNQGVVMAVAVLEALEHQRQELLEQQTLAEVEEVEVLVELLLVAQVVQASLLSVIHFHKI